MSDYQFSEIRNALWFIFAVVFADGLIVVMLLWHIAELVAKR